MKYSILMASKVFCSVFLLNNLYSVAQCMIIFTSDETNHQLKMELLFQYVYIYLFFFFATTGMLLLNVSNSSK